MRKARVMPRRPARAGTVLAAARTAADTRMARALRGSRTYRSRRQDRREALAAGYSGPKVGEHTGSRTGRSYAM